MSTAVKPTRREERRLQTVQEIKHLAMRQISEGGPDAVSLSGIVREMSMSPAAVYRYFASRDALLADLVVDAYNDLADHLASLEQHEASPETRLDAVLRGTRAWAQEHPNSYRLIFQTAIGSGKDFAQERTASASSRSMGVIVEALTAVTLANPAPGAHLREGPDEMTPAIRAWAERAGLADFSPDVLMLAFLTWTRLHGIISLELGGHLAATGLGADVLFEAETRLIKALAAELSPATSA